MVIFVKTHRQNADMSDKNIIVKHNLFDRLPYQNIIFAKFIYFNGFDDL